MSLLTRRITALVALPFAASLLLAGCSDDSKDSGKPYKGHKAATEDAKPTDNDSADNDSADKDLSDLGKGDKSDSSSQGEILNDYIERNRADIEGLMDSFAGVYDAITIKAVGDYGYELVYTFSEPIDPDLAAASFDLQEDLLRETAISQQIPELVSIGVTDNPTVVYTYLNPDGSVIWTRSFSG